MDTKQLATAAAHWLEYMDLSGYNPGGFNFPAHRNLRVSEGVENLLR